MAGWELVLGAEAFNFGLQGGDGGLGSVGAFFLRGDSGGGLGSGFGGGTAFGTPHPTGH